LDDMDFFYDTVLYDDGNLYDDTLNYWWWLRVVWLQWK
jgi:hypothetical protein